MLDKGCALAAEHGYRIAHLSCEEGEYPPALFSALGYTTLPAAPGSAGADAAHTRMLLVERAGSVVDHLASQEPLLISLDDVQFADQISLLALRVLPSQLRGKPVVWILARCVDRDNRDTARLYAHLERGLSTARVEIERLSPSAVTDLTRDLCQARPDQDLLDQLGELDGNPRSITELVNGYLDEGKISTEDGLARLSEFGEQDQASVLSTRLRGLPARPALPQRFLNLVEERLARLSRQTRLLLQAAAVLGPAFQPDDLTGLLGKSWAEIIAEAQEALDSGLLRTTDYALAFRDELLWRSMLDSFPVPLRTALHRRVADTHLERGGSVTEAAIHLLQGARHGDTATTRILAQASHEALASEPSVAAELARRGLEFADPGISDHTALRTVAVEALTRAGPLASAASTAREALARGLPPQAAAAAEYCLSIAETLGGQAAESQNEPDDATPDDHVEKLRVGFLQREYARDRDAAIERADELLTSPQVAEPAVRVTAMQICAQGRWEAGELHAGLGLAREAAELAQHTPSLPWHVRPRPTLTLMLVQVGKLREAAELVTAEHTYIESHGLRTLAGIPHLLRSRVALADDRLDEAVAEAHAGLAATTRVGMPLCDALGWDALITVTLRRGHLAQAEEAMSQLEASAQADPTARARSSWMRVQLAMAQDDTDTAAMTMRALVDHPGACSTLLVTEPVAGPVMARFGDERTRDAVTAACRRIAEDNPGFTALETAAAHAQAVLDRAPEILERTETYPDSWSCGVQNEDLAILYEPTDEHRAINYLDQALGHYSAHGAERDAARVRHRLRQWGVRRRHWNYTKRPASGWDSLTDTESSVARLVAQGLTNRQTAKRLFLSSHTVGFHLRQIFRKLDVRSRIELARDWGRARD
ncbi:ATP/maltotriose-dependent transcriptional regulator MalT [Actinopolyspora biskrensis]|uniref:ATP/maltotriose-dependent transcriptional regulator MalT n=1 Tax=Actinopolyspora biskrensis TaxID=1470178 RepID=A0A852Z4K7_9ACTN|nr:ATP/maltotriose-dependent transcriptional regulator MalT [Actinopolyspora biskrensis]